jgi:hypothetical protein
MAVIPACPAALPKLARLGLSPLGEDGPITSWLGFTAFDPGCSEEMLDLGAGVNTGALSSLESQARLNRRVVAPTHDHTPTAAEWHTLLPWVMDGAVTGAGTAASPYSYPLGNTLTRRYAAWHDTQVYWDLYAVGIDTATISASQADPAVRLSTEWVGHDWDNTGTFPPELVPPTDPPFILTDSDGAVLVNSVARRVESVSITINKNVARDRYFNSRTIACAVAQSRTVTVSLTVPWGLHSDLLEVGRTTSVPVSVAFTFGSRVLTFTMPRVRQPPRGPGASVPAEITNVWTGTALASSALNDELAATLRLTA